MIPLLLPVLIAQVSRVASPELPRLILPAHRTNIGVPLDRPDLYDGLMVATVLGPAASRPRSEDGYLAVQRVRVEDSRAFAPGTVVEVYYRALAGNRDLPQPAGTVIDQAGAPPVGARVLLVARAAWRGALRVPDLDQWEAPDERTLALGSSAPPSAWGEAFFLTSQTRLAPRSGPKERYVASIAQAIPRTGDANAARVADFMYSFRGHRPDDNYGKPDDWLSRAFYDAVENDTAYHRALVALALNRLKYWGSGDRFYIDMRAAASDPGAFPTGVPNLDFWEDVGTGNNTKLPKDFKHTSGSTWEEYRAILRRSKSPTVSAWLLQNMPKPPDADFRAMTRFLDSPDPRLRRAFVERLAAWNGEPAPAEPKESLGPDGRTKTEYPGLNAAVARWKARLRSAPKAG